MASFSINQFDTRYNNNRSVMPLDSLFNSNKNQPVYEASFIQIQDNKNENTRTARPFTLSSKSRMAHTQISDENEIGLLTNELNSRLIYKLTFKQVG